MLVEEAVVAAAAAVAVVAVVVAAAAVAVVDRLVKERPVAFWTPLPALLLFSTPNSQTTSLASSHLGTLYRHPR